MTSIDSLSSSGEHLGELLETIVSLYVVSSLCCLVRLLVTLRLITGLATGEFPADLVRVLVEGKAALPGLFLIGELEACLCKQVVLLTLTKVPG